MKAPPSTRPVLGALTLALLALAACDSGATEVPFLPETATPVPPEIVASPGTASQAFESFRLFGRQIADAMAANDTSFFLDSAILSSAEDGGEGIWLGLWRSEAVPEPPEGVRRLLADYFGEGPWLYALAAVYRDAGGVIGGPTYFAITALPADASTTHVLYFRLTDDTWRLAGVIRGGELSSDWLGGTCADCYDYWERTKGLAR